MLTSMMAVSGLNFGGVKIGAQYLSETKRARDLTTAGRRIRLLQLYLKDYRYSLEIALLQNISHTLLLKQYISDTIQLDKKERNVE